jgi:hypothetical protein
MPDSSSQDCAATIQMWVVERTRRNHTKFNLVENHEQTILSNLMGEEEDDSRYKTKSRGGEKDEKEG